MLILFDGMALVGIGGYCGQSFVIARCSDVAVDVGGVPVAVVVVVVVVDFVAVVGCFLSDVAGVAVQLLLSW